MTAEGFKRRVERLRKEVQDAKAKQRDTQGPEAEEKLAGVEEKTFPELRKEAKEKGIEGYMKMTKAQLIEALKEE